MFRIFAVAFLALVASLGFGSMGPSRLVASEGA